MMWKLLIVVACLTCGGLARPDVSHLLKKMSGDKQKRQNFIGASASLSGNGVILTEIKSGDAANVETLIPQITLLPLEENQPSPFRRQEDRSGYDYQKPDFPLDVHPDSNLVSPVSTQAPEYLPPEGGEETSNVDKVVPPSVYSTTPTTTSTTTTTPATTTTTTTTPAPSTYDVSSTQQEFDESEGYGYKKPEVMLPLNINEVIGEASDINQLATTTEPTTTTTPKESLEYLPPKPRPELVVPKQPSTTTGQPQTEPFTYPSSVSTTTQYQLPTETQDYPKQPEVPIYPDASGSVSTVVTQQTPTELPSTSAPEYLPPDENGFQIIVRIDSEDNETSPTTVSSGTSASSTATFAQSTEPTTTLLPALPEADSLVQQEVEQQPSSTQQDEQTTTSTTTSSFVSSTTLLAEESTGIPLDETSSMISLINQLQEMNQIAAQADFVPGVRFLEEDATTVESSPAPSTTTASSSTLTTSAATSPATEQPTERSETEAPSTLAPLPLESRLGSDETTGFSLIDLLSPTTTVAASPELPALNDTITTYRPSVTEQTVEQTTLAAESSADESEIQSRIANPDDDGYNYEAPENGLTVPSSIVPSSVVPSHTLEADGYHYKVPSVPFP
uniref:DUF4794 domain-containing protein n=1 Tax=Anopheles atroparvus TaxID=41427 RepID=A0AAG5DHG5_ANOAO